MHVSGASLLVYMECAEKHWFRHNKTGGQEEEMDGVREGTELRTCDLGGREGLFHTGQLRRGARSMA